MGLQVLPIPSIEMGIEAMQAKGHRDKPAAIACLEKPVTKPLTVLGFYQQISISMNEKGKGQAGTDMLDRRRCVIGISSSLRIATEIAPQYSRSIYDIRV